MTTAPLSLRASTDPANVASRDVTNVDDTAKVESQLPFIRANSLSLPLSLSRIAIIPKKGKTCVKRDAAGVEREANEKAHLSEGGLQGFSGEEIARDGQ